MRSFTRLFTFVLCGFLSSAAHGQTPQSATFDIADVHASPHTVAPNMQGGVLRAGRYELRFATMVDLIRTAYGIDADKVMSGPSWLELDRFDVIAKAPPSTTPETAKLMLQALLADRFKLAIHNDTKPMPALVLSVGRGKPKLKESDGLGNSGCQVPPNQTPAQPGVIRQSVLVCRGLTMEAFAASLRTMAANPLTAGGNNPVVDKTGLDGAWDFEITYTASGLLARAGAEGISIFDAVDKQLGLKLEEQKVATTVIVVDSVNRKPTDNLPGVTTNLRVIPTEFEVADLRLSQPGATAAPSLGFPRSGRVDLRNYPLTSLIALAWNITGLDALALAGPEAPKRLAAVRVDLIAKMPSTGAETASFDLDDYRPAVKALLIDRFKMVTHYEDRPADAYALVAGKPKLKKADPSNRAGCKQEIKRATGEPGAQQSLGAALVVVTCQNMTMAQFAEQLDSIAGNYVHYPVLDATALDGAWDFSLSYSAANVALAERLGLGALLAGGGGDGAASDPAGGITLFDAVEKQLGLKLELHKRPEPTFVIDHIEEKPTDN